MVKSNFVTHFLVLSVIYMLLRTSRVRAIGKCKKADRCWKKEDFVFSKQIAEGAYGAVKYAIEKESKYVFLVKEMFAESKSRRQEVVEMELEALDKLSTTGAINLIQVYGAAIIKGKNSNLNLIFFFMEPALDGDLSTFYKHQQEGLVTLNEEILRQIARGLFEGLKQIHKAGFVHRDIKESNILLNKESNGLITKIADFGLAKPCDKVSSDTLEGTVFYMAPEIVIEVGYGANNEASPVCKPNQMQKTDIWAAGVVLIGLITDKRDVSAPGIYRKAAKSFPKLRNIMQLARYFQMLIMDRLPEGWLAAWYKKPNELINKEPFSLDLMLFIADLLMMEPGDRPTAAEALEHKWFTGDIAGKEKYNDGEQLVKIIEKTHPWKTRDKLKDFYAYLYKRPLNGTVNTRFTLRKVSGARKKTTSTKTLTGLIFCTIVANKVLFL